MSKKLAILVIHGIGSQRPDFADKMVDEINDRVSDEGKDPNEIAWKSIYWADILETRQLKYLTDAKISGNRALIALRKFTLTAFADATAYQKVDSEFNTTYELIHEKVETAINEVYSDLGSSPKPMIVMAHSLGGHIMSNYVWDMQHASNPPSNEFESMNRLAGIVTFGCNIPFFSFAYEKVEPITFPPVGLPDGLKEKAKWLNYYDKDDVLGYPLKSINAAYAQVVTEDIEINVGSIFSSWNPVSHNKYWTDNDFTKPVSKFIASFL